MTLALSASVGTTPAALSAARSIESPSTFRRSPRRTSAVSLAVSETKPRLGKRRWSGIWPPSKPTLWKPAGARFLTFVAAARGLAEPAADAAPDALPGVLRAGRRLHVIQLHLTLALQEIRHAVDHAAVLRRIRHFHGLTDAAQAQARSRMRGARVSCRSRFSRASPGFFFLLAPSLTP